MHIRGGLQELVTKICDVLTDASVDAELGARLRAFSEGPFWDYMSFALSQTSCADFAARAWPLRVAGPASVASSTGPPPSGLRSLTSPLQLPGTSPSPE